MSLAIQQKLNPEGFVKPGELIDLRAGAELSLQDRRIFNLLVENAWSEIGENKKHRIAMSKLRGRHRGGERVGASVKSLMTTLVEVPTILEGQSAILAMQLLGQTTRVIDEDSPHAVLIYQFPSELRRIIQDSRYWGRIKAYVMFEFTSKYSLALYEALCLRANMRTTEQFFSVDDFRALIGVEEGKLPLYKNLKKWAIDQAIFEVNHLSDFMVEVDAKREGGLQRGVVKGFTLGWRKKTAEEWHEVTAELLRPKIGRRARLTKTVDKLV